MQMQNYMNRVSTAFFGNGGGGGYNNGMNQNYHMQGQNGMGGMNGMQGNMNNMGGMNGNMNNMGMQGNMNSMGMQGNMNSTGMQGNMNSGMHGNMNGMGMQGNMNGMGMQNMNTMGMQGNMNGMQRGGANFQFTSDAPKKDNQNKRAAATKNAQRQQQNFKIAGVTCTRKLMGVLAIFLVMVIAGAIVAAVLVNANNTDPIFSTNGNIPAGSATDAPVGSAAAIEFEFETHAPTLSQ